MKNKIIIMVVVGLLVVGGGGFYGGMKYAQSQNPRAAGGFNFTGGVRNGQGAGGAGGLRRSGGAGGANFLTGQIMAKSENSLTVGTPDGGSKIVFLSGSTQVSKFAAGSPSDLEVGKSVMINGTANADGSLTAQTIELRPAPPAGAGSGAASSSPAR